jgi:hypothetical protein
MEKAFRYRKTMKLQAADRGWSSSLGIVRGLTNPHCKKQHVIKCYRLRVFENRVLKRIFGPKRDKVKTGWRIPA